MNQDALNTFIQEVRESPFSDFYRARWGSARNFEDLPLIGPADLFAVPLQKRRYKDEKALVKIVRSSAGAFLSEWALEDIAAERYGVEGQRPLVLFADRHDAIEKSLWFYERNVLPLAAESQNLPISAFAAHRYKIDAILADEQVFGPFLAEYDRAHGPLAVPALTLLGKRFADAAAVRARFPSARFVLALSEAGAFAEACPKNERLVFHADHDSSIEMAEGEMIVTRWRFLPTPVIRYKSGIAATGADCLCGRPGFSLL